MKPGIGNYLSIIAAVGMALPLSTTSASEHPTAGAVPAKIITDVSLSADGDLLGAVLKKDGTPIAGQPVHVLAKQKVVASARTDVRGRYRIRGLRNGIHQVKVAGREQACRIWTAKTAPPAAQRGLITTNNGVTVRGQNGDFAFGGADLVGLAVFGGATAVTLITALDDDNSSASLSSGSGGSGVLDNGNMGTASP